MGVAPPAMPAVKTANLPVKPLVSGMPAKASRNSAKALATSGERFPRPAHCDRCVASPVESRTRVTIAKAPIVLESIRFPETVVSMAIEPESSVERKKLAAALDMLRVKADESGYEHRTPAQVRVRTGSNTQLIASLRRGETDPALNPQTINAIFAGGLKKTVAGPSADAVVDQQRGPAGHSPPIEVAEHPFDPGA